MVTLIADGSDYFDRTIPAVSISASTATGLPRETHTFVRIFDDDFNEDIEDFDIVLELDPFTMQSGIILRPNISTICIEDNDGKHTSKNNWMGRRRGWSHLGIPRRGIISKAIKPFNIRPYIHSSCACSTANVHTTQLFSLVTIVQENVVQFTAHISWQICM